MDNFSQENEKTAESLSNETASQSPENKDFEDIQFDEDINRDETQEKLQTNLRENDSEDTEAEEAQTETEEVQTEAEQTAAQTAEAEEESEAAEVETEGTAETEEEAEEEETEAAAENENEPEEDILKNSDIESSQFNEEEISAEITKKEALIDPDCKKYIIYINPENIDYIENLSISERKDLINNILKEQKDISAAEKRKKELIKAFNKAIIICSAVIIGFPLAFIIINKCVELTIENYNQSISNFSNLYKKQGKIKMQDNNIIPKIKY